MARIPLEDNFDDVINKAQRGLRLSDADLATRAEVSPNDLAAVKGGTPMDAVIRRVARHLSLSPDALQALAHKSWYPQQPNFPTGFVAFNSAYGDMRVNSFMIWDGRTKLAAIFDTGGGVPTMIDVLHTEDLKLQYIFITHAHDDHIPDLVNLVAATNAEVWLSDLEPKPDIPVKTFQENQHFHLGPISIKTLLTSGHSPGLTTFYITGLSWPLAIVGDSIFASSAGGSPDRFAEQLRNDRLKILTLPNDTVLACGHGPLTTVGQEKKNNPFFAT